MFLERVPVDLGRRNAPSRFLRAGLVAQVLST